jgi:hypothetical protein
MQRVKNVVRKCYGELFTNSASSSVLGILKIPNKRAVWNSFVLLLAVCPLIAHYTPTLTHTVVN